MVRLAPPRLAARATTVSSTGAIQAVADHPAPASFVFAIMLTLRSSSPFDLFDRLDQQLSQQLQTAERVPAAEVRESETHYLITLELPGVAKDSIDVKASDRSLVVSAERRAPQPENNEATSAALLSEIRYGTWSRSFRFPSGIDREAVQAVYRDGLLTVEVPKAQTLTSVNVKVEG